MVNLCYVHQVRNVGVGSLNISETPTRLGQLTEQRRGLQQVAVLPMQAVHDLEDRFRPDPVGAYFAGDGAKLDSDGCYWLLGRVDDVMLVANDIVIASEGHL